MDCGDYQIADPKDPRLCKAVTCDKNSKVNKDGTCQQCDRGFIASTDGKSCMDVYTKVFSAAIFDAPAEMLDFAT